VPDKGRVEELLRLHAGNVARVASELEQSWQSLYRLLDRLGIDASAFRA